MQIKLIALGKTDHHALQTLIDDYTKRLAHYIKFEYTIIPDIKNAKNLSESQQKQKVMGPKSLITQVILYKLFIITVVYVFIDNICVCI